MHEWIAAIQQQVPPHARLRNFGDFWAQDESGIVVVDKSFDIVPKGQEIPREYLKIWRNNE